MKYTKKSHITNTDEVKDFFHYAIHKKHIMSHPDDPITNCTTDKKPLYERLLEECFEVCKREKADIYGIFLEEYKPLFIKEMEKIIN